MTPTVRVGIIGLGGIARSRHVPGLRAIPGVSIDAVANSSAASSNAVARDLGIPRAYADWRHLIADPELDAVVVSTWPSGHAAATIAALDEGRHVLVEGRMAMDAGEAAAMLEAARRNPGRVAMVVPGPLTGWADATVIRLLAGGSLGPLRRVHASWASPRTGPDVEAWRLRRSDSGSNVMALGILYESLVRWLGPAGRVTATARLVEPQRVVSENAIEADVPDDVVALIRFRDEVDAVLEMSSVATAGVLNQVRLHADGGTLVVDVPARSLELIGGDGTRTPVDVPADERRDWQVEADFVAAIHGERRPGTVDFETALEHMRFTDAVHRSSATGRRVDLPG